MRSERGELDRRALAAALGARGLAIARGDDLLVAGLAVVANVFVDGHGVLFLDKDIIPEIAVCAVSLRAAGIAECSCK